MTREEAIEVIKAYRDKLTNSVSNQLDGDVKAFEMAISAILENEELSKDLDEALKEIDMYERGLSQECVGSTQKHVENALDMRCDDAISRETLIAKLTELIKTSRSTIEIKAKLIPMIQSMPSVTQKSGEWIDINGIYAECSNCNEEIYITGDFRYCPNCGAKMESGDKE